MFNESLVVTNQNLQNMSSNLNTAIEQVRFNASDIRILIQENTYLHQEIESLRSFTSGQNNEARLLIQSQVDKLRTQNQYEVMVLNN